jgi:hypothetical protein
MAERNSGAKRKKSARKKLGQTGKKEREKRNLGGK